MGFYVGKNNNEKNQKKFKKKNINIGIYGLTFKENTNDVRDSKVFDIIKILNRKNNRIYAFDPKFETKRYF